MNRHETVEKCFSDIMDLKGNDEFKEAIKRLHVFLMNKEARSLNRLTLPNYLWVAKRGGGITTLINAFANYLYATKAIEFCGIAKSFEFKLEYVAPDRPFMELTRFHVTKSGYAGRNRYFKGVVCVDINDWLERAHEDHFADFLSYVSSNNDKFLVIFCIHTDAVNALEAIETALSTNLRIETLKLRFPNVDELVELVISKSQEHGFDYIEESKALLGEAIKEISSGKQFNGYKTINRLTEVMLYSILTTGLHGHTQIISADMLYGHSKDSEYVKREKARINAKKKIGFTERDM